MSNSSLTDKFTQAYSGNYTKNRAAQGSKITEITIHHFAAAFADGLKAIDWLGRLWQTVGRKGSSHYGVGGRYVGQYVAESDVSWCNSNWAANCRAVTIETANSKTAPNWEIAADTLQTLIKLVADIAKRNKLGTLVVGKNLTYHSMYAATACPGPYLKARLQYIANEANKINAGNGGNTEDTIMAMSTKPVKMWFGAMSGGDMNSFKALLAEKQIPYTEAAGVLTTSVEVSKGDQVPLMQKAISLGIGYGPVTEQGGDCTELEAKLAAETQRANEAAALAAKETARADRADEVALPFIAATKAATRAIT